MNKIIKEPLVHFLLLGALIYLASIVFGNSNIQTQDIIVSEGKIKHLTRLFEKTWQREPAPDELNHIVQEYVLEQAAYYEGVNLGLDKNDIVVVRRVRQKLDFIAEEATPMPQVTDELLTAYLQSHVEDFRLEPTFTLRQVYLDPKQHGPNINSVTEALLDQLTLRPKQDISKLGDSYLFKPQYQKQSLTQLKHIFGQPFMQKLNSLTIGQWHSSMQSSYGLHLIYIEEKKEESLPELAQIRSTVLREWENSLRKQSTKDYYQELLTRYPATVHWPILK